MLLKTDRYIFPTQSITCNNQVVINVSFTKSVRIIHFVETVNTLNQGEQEYLRTMKRMIGFVDSLAANCLLKRAIAGKIKRKIEVTGR